MDWCVLLTSTPSYVVSPRGETTHSGVDVNNTHQTMITPLIIFDGADTDVIIFLCLKRCGCLAISSE